MTLACSQKSIIQRDRMQHYELLKEYMDSCNRERYRDHEQIRLTDMPANAGFVDDE